VLIYIYSICSFYFRDYQYISHEGNLGEHLIQLYLLAIKFGPERISLEEAGGV